MVTGLLASLALGAVTRWPFLARVPWRLLGILLVCLVLFAGGWTVRGWRDDAERAAAIEQARQAERQAFELRDRQHREQADRDQVLLTTAALERERLQSELSRLQAATVALPLIRTETKVAHADCSCPDPRIAPAFRVCFNAGATGDPAALAACEAERLSNTVQGQ